MNLQVSSLLLGTVVLASCSGVFDSSLPAPQAYVLRMPSRTAPAPATSAGSVLVQRPEARPGLGSDRIAVLRSDRRFDFYASSRWAAAAPDLVESLIVDALRAGGAFSSVYDDSAPYAPRYALRCTLRRFEADYTAGGRAPTVFVALDCTLGRHRDRELLASFTAQGSAPASDDRLSAVVAAFETATTSAVNELERATAAGIANEVAPTETTAQPARK